MPAIAASQASLDSTDLLALPVLPVVVAELLETLGRKDADMRKLVRLAGYDAILSTRILTVASCAACRDRTPRRPNLESMLTALGLETINTIAATSAFHQSLGPSQGIPVVALNRFHRHSLICAHLTQRLALAIDYPDPEEAYLCGLLHDIGKLIIGVRHGKVFAALQEIHHFTGTPHEMLEQEKQSFDTDHCTLGATLVETWQLHSFLADAIRFHHLDASELRGSHPLLRLLHVANTLSQEDEPPEAVLVDADHLLGLNRTLLHRTRLEVKREVIALARDLGIAGPTVSDRPSTVTAPNPASCAPMVRGRISSDSTRKRITRVGDQSTLAEIAMTQDRLGQTIYEHALVNEARSEMRGADDQPELARTIARCAAILFDTAETHLFLIDPETGQLRDETSESASGAIVIDPTKVDNAVSRAWREQRIEHSLTEDTPAGAIDLQLSQSWGTEGVLCFPLRPIGSDPLGVLAVGTSRTQLPRVQAHIRLWRLFVAAAATELDRLRQRKTKRQRAQDDRRLLEQQHLRAMVHEISNPLTIVLNYLHLLDIQLKEQAQHDELKVLREEIERIGRLLPHLSEPGRGAPEGVGFSLNKTIQDLARVLDDALCRPHAIRLNLKLADTLPLLRRGQDAIRQMLLNLVRNAVEALQPGGSITISTHVRANPHGHPSVEMTVADDGPGLPDHLRARLFQPVVSTKGDGHAGLGLAIVKSLAEQLGGQALCHPNTDGGTVFLVLLPLT